MVGEALALTTSYRRNRPVGIVEPKRGPVIVAKIILHQIAMLAQRDAVAADALIEFLGDAFDALGGGGERGGDRGLRALGAIGGGDARLLRPRHLLLEALEAFAHLGEFVGDGERRHHGEPVIADLAEFGAQAAIATALTAAAERIESVTDKLNQTIGGSSVALG